MNTELLNRFDDIVKEPRAKNQVKNQHSITQLNN